MKKTQNIPKKLFSSEKKLQSDNFGNLAVTCRTRAGNKTFPKRSSRETKTSETAVAYSNLLLDHKKFLKTRKFVMCDHKNQ